MYNVLNTPLFLVSAYRITNCNTKRSRKTDAQNSWERILYYGRIYGICAIHMNHSDKFNMWGPINRGLSQGSMYSRAVVGIKLPNER